MALVMNMDPALGFGLNGFRVLPRQQAKCDAGAMGSGGICVTKSTCDGALYPTNCGEGLECCFLSGCDVPEGHGNCKNDTRDPCDDGRWITGDLSKAPCKGPNEMRCCVKFADMNNGTSSTTSITSTAASATASATASTASTTSTNTSSGSNDNGLKGNQIGGVVGGVLGFVVVVIAVAFLWLWLRRKSQPTPPPDGFSPDPPKHDKLGFTELPGHGSGGVPMQEIGEGRQRVEVDAHGQELYEMEGNSPIAELDGGDVRKT